MITKVTHYITCVTVKKSSLSNEVVHSCLCLNLQILISHCARRHSSLSDPCSKLCDGFRASGSEGVAAAEAVAMVAAYRSLSESLQQLLLDGVVQLSSDQSFLLQTQQTG